MSVNQWRRMGDSIWNLRSRVLDFSSRKRWRNDLLDGSAAPIPCSPVVPGASRSRFSLLEKLVIVDARRPAVLGYNLAVDDDRFYIRAVAVFHQSVDGIAHRTVARRAQVDNNQIRFGSRRDFAEIVPAQLSSAADRGGIENIRRTGAGRILADEPRNQKAEAVISKNRLQILVLPSRPKFPK